jgi:lipopolysaccharide export LptBFGC system permease protein LptF
MEKSTGITRNDILTALALFAFAVLVIVLFLGNKAQWNQKIATSQLEADSLRNTVLAQYEELRTYDSLAGQYTRDNRYDPLVESGFRMYGLFKARRDVYDAEMLANKFHITNVKSIKYNEGPEETWFIIPVKGAHFVRPGESATSLAKYYYGNAADSVLIRDFNPDFGVFRTVFIPFEK